MSQRDAAGASLRTARNAGAALALLGGGVLIGWLVLGGGRVASHTLDVVVAVATIATAVGTLVLAVATYYLAAQTREVVSVSRQESEAAREDLAVAQAQADTASAALEAQTQPFLTVGDTSPKHLGAGHAHVRNAGNGTAIVSAVRFIADTGTVFPGAAKRWCLQPRGPTWLRLQIHRPRRNLTRRTASPWPLASLTLVAGRVAPCGST